MSDQNVTEMSQAEFDALVETEARKKLAEKLAAGERHAAKQIEVERLAEGRPREPAEVIDHDVFTTTHDSHRQGAKTAKNDERSGIGFPAEVPSLPCSAGSWRTWRLGGKCRTVRFSVRRALERPPRYPNT